jgi:uncharacterized protein YcbK (DUF882 family)
MRTALILLALTLAAPTEAASIKCLPQQLKTTLHKLKKFGRVQVISTYRKGARIAGTRKISKHASCRAVDFHLKGNKRAAIKWLRKQRLEVITYGCGMHHIHIATGSYKGHHCVDRRGKRRR